MFSLSGVFFCLSSAYSPVDSPVVVVVVVLVVVTLKSIPVSFLSSTSFCLNINL